MNFIKDQQFEGIALIGNQVTGGVISGDGQRTHEFLCPVIHPNLQIERITESSIPLMQQINGRSNHNG